MVGVTVREQDGVDAGKVIGERLLRQSVEVSTRIDGPPTTLMWIDGRDRRSRGSVD